MIVLDTHAWIWWITGDDQLSPTAARRLKPKQPVGISAISVWEVAMLVERGRLQLDRDVLQWVNEALSAPEVELLPLSPEVAVRATRLGSSFHKDPADQLIVATALEHRAPLISRDERIRRSGAVEVIW